MAKELTSPQTIQGTWTLPDGATYPGTITFGGSPEPVMPERSGVNVTCTLPPVRVTRAMLFGESDA
jgi:hypothetical protein